MYNYVATICVSYETVSYEPIPKWVKKYEIVSRHMILTQKEKVKVSFKCISPKWTIYPTHTKKNKINNDIYVFCSLHVNARS